VGDLTEAYAAHVRPATAPFELSDDAKRVRRALEDALIEHGRTPNTTALAISLGLTVEAARDALLELEHGIQVMFVPGTEDILKVPPFSNAPTRHAVSVDGEQRWYGGCAAESCAVAPIFRGREVTVTSSCPDCGGPIEVVFHGSEVVSITPPTAVVHWGVHPRDFATDLVVSCDRINFFVDATHARIWEERVSGEPGVVTTIEATVRATAGIAASRHWDYDRGPEYSALDGTPLLDAVRSTGADLTPWE
jgi:hypothetical protein